MAYDFRSKFHLSIEDIGGSVSLRETVLLVSVLLRDTDSWLQAAVHEWKYPVTREFEPLVNLYDLTVAINSKKKPKPYPRPWPSEGKQKIGKPAQSRAEVLRRLEQMNPKENNGN